MKVHTKKMRKCNILTIIIEKILSAKRVERKM